MEARLFPLGERAHVSTAEFHEHRERAPHLEQYVHRPRLDLAARFIGEAIDSFVDPIGERVTVSDLGCGDGGLLQLVGSQHPQIDAWGYDFQPSNTTGWQERGVHATQLDVFGSDLPIHPDVKLGSIVVMTEVLEHLTDPHAVVEYIRMKAPDTIVVASSPWTETAESHDACHAWAWDRQGYLELFVNAGWTVHKHETTGMFQVVLAI